MRHAGLTILFCLFLAATVYGDTIAVWNFNDAVSGIGGGEREFLVDYGSGIMTSSFAGSNIGNAAGSAVNAYSDDPAGRALRLSSSANNGKDLTWKVSTEGFDSIGIGFAVQGTGTGFSSNQFLYSLDSGVSWLNFGPLFNPASGFALRNFDLSGITGINDNLSAAFRILFNGATSGSGNNKIDNLIVSGNPMSIPNPTPVPESSTIALTAGGLVCVLLSRKGRKREG
jgi:hypothetical protein